MSIRAINWAVKVFETTDLPPQERAILLALCIHHNEKSGECFPSYERLALLTGYRRRRVAQGLKWLIESGLIRSIQRRVNGHQGSNKYILFGAFSARSRVRKKALSQSAPVCTQGRVPPSARDKEDIFYREECTPDGGKFQGLRVVHSAAPVEALGFAEKKGAAK